MPLFLALWIFFLSSAFGTFFLRLSRLNVTEGLEKLSFSFVLGYGLLGYFVYIGGLAGWLDWKAVAASLALMSILLLKDIIFWVHYFAGAGGRLWGCKKENPLLFFTVLASGAVLVIGLFQALLPPTAHDALCYHLYIPKRFVETGRIEYFPYLVNSLFPFLLQMHFTLALVFGHPELAGVFHFFTGVGVFLGLAALGRRLGGLLTGVTAGLVFILTPGIFNQLTIPYNDVGLACFIFFALYALIKMTEEKEKIRWCALMGMLSGFALSVKYLALFHIAALVIVMCSLFLVRKIPVKVFICGLAAYLSVTVIFSFVWYLRSYLYEGNPVYPFFPAVFGGTAKIYEFDRAGMGKGPFDLALAAWRMTMFPQKFGGTWAQPGLVYVTFLPLIVKVPFKELSLKLAAVFSLLYFLFWFYTVQNLRFLFPVIPVFALFAALAARRFPIWLAFLLLLNAAFAVYHGKAGYAYLLGLQSRGQYLLQNERSYAMAEWVNSNLFEGSKILNMEEVRMFYFDPPMIREREFRKKTKYDIIAGSPDAALEILKNENITHVLVTPLDENELEELGPMSVRRLIADPAVQERFFKPVKEMKNFENMTYQLYEILYPGQGSSG